MMQDKHIEIDLHKLLPFPFNPFPSRPARLVRQSFNGGGAIWDFAKRLRRFAQKSSRIFNI